MTIEIKRKAKRLTSLFMAVIMFSLAPLVQASPASAADEKKSGNYISEIKIGMGETEAEAKKDLEAEGFTILKDEDGNLADLNVDAGSASLLKKGANDKIVYLGYKTTDNASDAITDLAVMNMKGGYSIEDYNALMDQQMDTQIKPFVDRFIATLNEYRANYKKAKTSLNYKRANYIRKMLNQMTDDDTGGQPLGDLLLNETKYELGDAAYEKLPEKEKKNHADILTILMQANGQATLTMENLLTQAADTNKDTWTDRFLDTTLSDLEDQVQAEDASLSSHKDVLKALDRKYGDAAKELLKKWQSFKKDISDYEDKAEDILDCAEEIEDQMEEIEDIDFETASEEEMDTYNEVSEQVFDQAIDSQTVAIGVWLESKEYDSDTLREFFEQDYKEVSSDSGIRKLYPIVDALTDGQIAGLEFLSFPELFQIAMSDAAVYENMADMMKEVQTESIYAGVDRGIYEKGGVALTSDALRAKAANSEAEPTGYTPSALTISMWGVTAGFAVATGTTKVVANVMAKAAAKTAAKTSETLKSRIADIEIELRNLFFKKSDQISGFDVLKQALGPEALEKGNVKYDLLKAETERFNDSMKSCTDQISNLEAEHTQLSDKLASGAGQKAGTSIADKLAIGFAVVTVIMTVVSTVMTFLEASAYYDTEYIPIPKYMVERADITAQNESGKEIMIKNQTAYYKVVPCNRTAGDSKITKKNYETMDDRNDLNGDIGRQWLALYAVKHEYGTPILADSLLYKKESSTVPEGYSTGIHEFGGKAACNLNNQNYLFPDKTPSIQVFFKIDKKTVNELTGAGSVFGTGTVAMSGGIGLVIGAVFGALVVGRRKK